MPNCAPCRKNADCKRVFVSLPKNVGNGSWSTKFHFQRDWKAISDGNSISNAVGSPLRGRDSIFNVIGSPLGHLVDQIPFPT